MNASDHDHLAAIELGKSTPDWAIYHAHKAAAMIEPAGKTGLIIGCARGEECQKFIEFGASYIHGVDPMQDIGMNFQSETVTYHQSNAEILPLADESVDFIYSFATFEHVHGLAAAWWEAARVLRPGGIVRTIAAPLWNSLAGPHWGPQFDAIPWAHLRFKPSDLVAYFHRSTDETFDGVDENQIRYWLDPRFFNMRWARDYIHSCALPEQWRVLQNVVMADYGQKQKYDPVVLEELYALGYDDQELFGGVHEFLAIKDTKRP